MTNMTHEQNLMLDTLAYIETHRSEWKQETWRCKTGMCFAGHAAMTLNPAKPVLGIKEMTEWAELREIINKQGSPGLSEEQRARWVELDALTDKLYAKAGDPSDDVTTITVAGKEIRAVAIVNRAERLLGGHEMVTDLETPGIPEDLFSSENHLADIRKFVGFKLGMSQAALRAETRRRAEERGWTSG